MTEQCVPIIPTPRSPTAPHQDVTWVEDADALALVPAHKVPFTCNIITNTIFFVWQLPHLLHVTQKKNKEEHEKQNL